MRYLQSVGDHSVEQLWNVVVFDEERRTKPLRMFLQMFANPFTGPPSEWPNKGKRTLWQNPDIGLTRRAIHCLRSVFANGGSGLIGNSGGRRTNVFDNISRLTSPGFIILLRKSGGKVPEDCSKGGRVSREKFACVLQNFCD